MEIETITPTLMEKGFGKRECRSMYEAHSHKIYNDANGFPTDVYVDGVLQDGLSEDLQHPDTYIVKHELNKSE